MDPSEQNRDVLLVDPPTRAEPASRLTLLDRFVSWRPRESAQMTHDLWDPSAGVPTAPEQRGPPLGTHREPWLRAVTARTTDDGLSFDAGRRCGTRVAACLARVSALELVDGSRWWNRRGRRRIAAALVAHAEDLESAADADGPDVRSFGV